MRTLSAALVVAALALSTPTRTTAQVSGVAFAALNQGSGIGWNGPWRASVGGMDINYAVICIDTIDPTRKVVGDVVASVPNGSSLAELRVIVTTAVQSFCASPPTNPDLGISVPRAAVLLPQLINGQ